MLARCTLGGYGRVESSCSNRLDDIALVDKVAEDSTTPGLRGLPRMSSRPHHRLVPAHVNRIHPGRWRPHC